MSEDKELSVLSEFLKKKVEEKDWSKKEFSEKTSLSLAYAYEVLSVKEILFFPMRLWKSFLPVWSYRKRIESIFIL